MQHISPPSTPITHSSLSAFLKDHRNVELKTCLVNFLNTEAYALNLVTFFFPLPFGTVSLSYLSQLETILTSGQRQWRVPPCSAAWDSGASVLLGITPLTLLGKSGNAFGPGYHQALLLWSDKIRFLPLTGHGAGIQVSV